MKPSLAWNETLQITRKHSTPINTSLCLIHVREDQNFLYFIGKWHILHTDLMQHIGKKSISVVYRKTLQWALKNLKGRWLWLAICIISFTDHNLLMQKNSVLRHYTCPREPTWALKDQVCIPASMKTLNCELFVRVRSTETLTMKITSGLPSQVLPTMPKVTSIAKAHAAHQSNLCQMST